MKPVVKINFADFWEPFDKKGNFFYKLLSENYTIELSENPEFLFYSSYGQEYLKYNCIRIFYASENLRPDFLQCDYALSFDYNKKANHFRLPLYHLYIDGHGYYDKLTKKITAEEATAIWKQKTKFCCMLVSNPNSKERINFFNALSKIKKVDSGGSYLNNIGYTIEDKMAFIKDYKFVFAFENSSYPGYTTEKILEPLITNCIPIYWGNSRIEKDFNADCFVNASNYSDYESLIEKLMEIDNQDNKAIAMITQKKVAENANDHLLIKQGVLNFLSKIINAGKKLPVAQNKWVRALIKGKLILRKIENNFLKRVPNSENA